MPRRIIDISVALQNDIASDPPGQEPRIKYVAHNEGAGLICRHFPGLTPQDLPDGEGWAVERIDISTHNGTHLDAPWHFASTMDGGRRAITIDEVPLEWCFQPGVKLDFRHLPDGHVVTAAEVEAELDRIGHTLRPLEIVVVNTAAGKRYGETDYVPTGCGMGREATLYLTSRGVRVTGTDAWSWDAPFVHTAKRYSETRQGEPDLGRAQGRPRDRLLPHREAAQPRGAARHRVHDRVLPREDQSGVGGLDARRRHYRCVSRPIRPPPWPGSRPTAAPRVRRRGRRAPAARCGGPARRCGPGP